VIGDAEAFHHATAILTGKNALYLDGRVERSKVAIPQTAPSIPPSS
jgi:hypothetical protein